MYYGFQVLIMVIPTSESCCVLLRPLALRSNPPRFFISKLHPWAIHLSRFSFTIVHIQRIINIFVYQLTPWSRECRLQKVPWGKAAALYQSIFRAAAAINKLAQNKITRDQNIQRHPTRATRTSERVVLINSFIPILQDANELKLKIMFNGHCQSSGHWSKRGRENIVSKIYWWKEMKQGLSILFKYTYIIFCHEEVKGSWNQWSQPCTNRSRTKLFTWETRACKAVMFVIVIKDDLSSFPGLHACTERDAESAVKCLLRWIAALKSKELLLSDNNTLVTAYMMQENM